MTAPSPYTYLQSALLPILEHIVERDCLASSVAVSLPSFGLMEISAGHRDRERTRPALPGLLFQAGSQVKTYIGAAITLLVKEGRISFDDPVTDYIAGAERLAGAKPMTVRHLLHHQSGIGDFSAFFGGSTPPPWPLPHLSREEIVLLAAIDGRKFEAGTDWQYSNTGYALLGMVIEQAAGSTVADFLSAHFFEPLDLRNTSLASDSTQPHERMAGGYVAVRGGGRFELMNSSELPDLSWARSSGDLVTNLPDALTWIRALGTNDPRIGIGLHDLNGCVTDLWAHRTKYPLRPRHYGFGVSDPVIAGQACWGHSGGTPGYSSGTYFEPASGIALAFYMTYEDDLHPDTDVLLEIRKTALLNAALSIALHLQKGLSWQAVRTEKE